MDAIFSFFKIDFRLGFRHHALTGPLMSEPRAIGYRGFGLSSVDFVMRTHVQQDNLFGRRAKNEDNTMFIR